VANATLSDADLGECVLQTRRLGQTDIAVSPLGLGTVKFGRNQGVKYPQAFALPSDKEIKTLLSLAKDSGINLLDTAPAYGESENRLGTLLSSRHDWIICTKAGETFHQGESQFDFSQQAIVQSVEQSLKRLRTDYLDILLIHSNGDDEHLIKEENIFDALAVLKQAGKIRAYGMSTKTVVGGLLTIDQADLAMVTYHPNYTDERDVILAAQKKQKGIFIKKAFASGHLQSFGAENPVKASLEFILKEPGVTSVIVGTVNPAHLKESVRCVGGLY
jgi:aryl-alcohol dehydrogenase-like predicted oxidoreductase